MLGSVLVLAYINDMPKAMALLAPLLATTPPFRTVRRNTIKLLEEEMNRELEKTANCLRTTAWGFTRTKQGTSSLTGTRKLTLH